MRKVAALLFLVCAVAGVTAYAQSHHRTENPALLGIVPLQEKDKVVVGHVLKKSPAAKAGLQVGDEILEVDGKDIARPQDVDAALSGAAAGDKVDVVYRRAKKRGTASAKLVARRDYRGDFFKSSGRGRTGFKAPDWYVYAWANVPKGKEAPTRKNTKGKVVVIHCFQSW